MATIMRAEVSEKNKYWISKHRHYELRYFCRQYPAWRRTYKTLNNTSVQSSSANKLPSSNIPADPTGNTAARKVDILEKMNLIESAAIKADKELADYILKGITEGLSYTQLRSKLNIPCSRDTYYDRYRRFFWLLDKERK